MNIIGDFFLQTDTICEGKNSKGFRRLIYLAIHSGINAALAYLLVGMLECWLIPVVVFVTHYIIDYVKSCVNSKDTWVFIIDQLAHVTVIVLLWAWITDTQLCLNGDWLSDYRLFFWGLSLQSGLPRKTIRIACRMQDHGLAILKEF